MNKKLVLITIFGLYIPFTTLTSEKPNHQTTKQYSITTFDPERDTQSVTNLFAKERYHLKNRYPESYIKSCHHNHYCDIKILRENNEFAGFIGYYSSENRGNISYLAIEENFRGKGYGKKLLTHSMKDLHNKGINSIKICTKHNNIPALTLYGKTGFKETFQGLDAICLEYNPSIIQTILSQLIKAQKNKESF